MSFRKVIITTGACHEVQKVENKVTEIPTGKRFDATRPLRD